MASEFMTIMEIDPLKDQTVMPHDTMENSYQSRSYDVKIPLDEIINSPDQNIATMLSENDRNKIAELCINEYNMDKSSRAKWEKDYDKALKLAKMETIPKNYPYQNASSVIYPLVRTACMHFSARAYPNIIQNDQIVRGKISNLAYLQEYHAQKIPGQEDLQSKSALNKIAKEYGELRSYQILEEMEGFESALDRLLNIVPLVGCGFKKTFLDTRKMQPKSIYVSAEDCVIHYS